MNVQEKDVQYFPNVTIHSFNKYLQSPNYLTNTAPHAEDTTTNIFNTLEYSLRNNQHGSLCTPLTCIVTPFLLSFWLCSAYYAPSLILIQTQSPWSFLDHHKQNTLLNKSMALYLYPFLANRLGLLITFGFFTMLKEAVSCMPRYSKYLLKE